MSGKKTYRLEAQAVVIYSVDIEADSQEEALKIAESGNHSPWEAIEEIDFTIRKDLIEEVSNEKV